MFDIERVDTIPRKIYAWGNTICTLYNKEGRALLSLFKEGFKWESAIRMQLLVVKDQE